MTGRHERGTVTTATVLSIDIVRSTETRVRMGEERADRHFDSANQLLSAVADVADAPFKRGRGDGLTAVFDSVMAGLDAALAIEQELSLENRWASEPITIRAALSVGDVVWTKRDVDGLPLVEAARLMDMADGGQVLCTATVRKLANRRPLYGFRELGRREAKGLPEPLDVHEFLWREVDRVERLPLWLDDHHHLLPMVGRDAELGALESELAAAEHGTRHVHLWGDQGEGKTRLASAIARTALARGFILMAGRCSDPPREAHEPIVAAIESLAYSSFAQVLRAGVDDQLGTLRIQAPALVRDALSLTRPGSGDPVSRAELVAAVRMLIERLADVRPVLLFIDDLHWASAESLRILRALTWDEAPPRLFVLTTSRLVPATASDPAAAELRRLHAESNVLNIRPLNGHDIAKALSAVETPTSAGPDADRLHQITGGNAFLVTEMARELVSGRELSSMPVPDTVKTVIRARLDQLGPKARKVADLLAVGERLRADVLRAAAGLDEAGFAEAEVEMTAAGLLTRAPELQFQLSHELTRRAIYAMLAPPQAGLLHGLLADLLLQLDPKIAESRPYVIATHLLAAAEHGHDVSRAVQAARAADRAARHALSRLAYGEAVTWYEQIVTHMERNRDVTAEQQAQSLVEYGKAMWLAGDPRARATLHRAAKHARECGRNDLIIAAASAGERGFFSITAAHDPDRIALLEEALQLTDPADLKTKALLTAQLASELTWAPDPDGERRFALSDAALALARRSHDPRTIVNVLGLRNLTIVPEITLDQRYREADTMLEAARRTGDDLLLFNATFQRTGPLLDTGDTSGLTDCLDQAAELAQRLAQPHLSWLVGFSRAGLSIMRGDLKEAETRSRQARQLGEEIGRQHEAVPFYTVQMAEVRRLRGRLESLRAVFREAVHLVDMDPVHSVLRYLCELGDDTAGPLLDQIVSERGLIPRRDVAQRAALDNLAFAAARLRRTDLTEQLYEALEPHAETFGHSSVAHHCGHHYLAHLAAANGQTARAAEHFQAAAAIHERRGVPLLMAESLLDWADLIEDADGAAAASRAPAPQDLRERCTRLLAGRDAALLENRLARLR